MPGQREEREQFPKKSYCLNIGSARAPRRGKGKLCPCQCCSSVGTRRAALCPLPAPSDGDVPVLLIPGAIPRAPPGASHVAGSPVARSFALAPAELQEHGKALLPPGSGTAKWLQRGRKEREKILVLMQCQSRNSSPPEPLCGLSARVAHPLPLCIRGSGRGTHQGICHTGSLSGPQLRGDLCTGTHSALHLCCRQELCAHTVGARSDSSCCPCVPTPMDASPLFPPTHKCFPRLISRCWKTDGPCSGPTAGHSPAAWALLPISRPYPHCNRCPATVLCRGAAQPHVTTQGCGWSARPTVTPGFCSQTKENKRAMLQFCTP